MNVNKKLFVQIVLPAIISVLGGFVLVSLFHGRAADIVGANHMDSYSYYYDHHMRHPFTNDLAVGLYDIGQIPDTISPRLWISKHLDDLLNYHPRAVVLDFIFEHRIDTSSDDALIASINRLNEALNGQLYTACLYHPSTKQIYHSFFTLENNIKFGHVNLDSYQGIHPYELVNNEGGAPDTVQWMPIKFANPNLNTLDYRNKLVDYTERNLIDQTVVISSTPTWKQTIFNNNVVIVGNVKDPRDLQEPNYRKHIWAPANESNYSYKGVPGVYLLAYAIDSFVNNSFLKYDSFFWPLFFSFFYALLFCFFLFALERIRNQVNGHMSTIIESVCYAISVLIILFCFEFYLIPLSSSLVLRYLLTTFSLEYPLVSVAVLAAIYPSFKR